MLILEGPDGGGKSSFAKRLALPIVHPGAAPKTEEAEQALFDRQFEQSNQPLIYDRVTCISQQVYQKRLLDPWYWAPLRKMLKMSHCLVVYCRPPDDVLLDFSRHTVAEHDTPEQMDYVRQNGRLFVESYDRLMSLIPHVKYDFTSCEDDDQLIVRLLRSQFDEKEWKRWTRELKQMQKTF